MKQSKETETKLNIEIEKTWIVEYEGWEFSIRCLENCCFVYKINDKYYKDLLDDAVKTGEFKQNQPFYIFLNPPAILRETIILANKWMEDHNDVNPEHDFLINCIFREMMIERRNSYK